MSALKISALSVIFSACLGLGISYGPVYLFHFAGVVFVIVLFRSMLIRTDGTTLKTFLFEQTRVRMSNFLWLMVTWYALTLIWSRDIQLGLYHLFYILNGILIVLVFQQAVKNVSDLRKFVLVSGAMVIVEMLICFLTGVFGIQWPISPYSDHVVLFLREPGFAENLPESAIEAIRHTPTGFRWNPNDLAVTMLIVLPFFLFFHKRLVAIAGTLASVAIVFLTGSRGALIGLVFMALAFVFLYLNRRQKLITLGIATVGMLVLFAASPMLKSQYPVKYREISTTGNALKSYLFADHEQVNDTSSIAIRQNLVSNGMNAWLNTYGMGVGAGNSVLIQMESDNTHGVFSMHNFWIEILVEAGIIFFLLWCTWYFLLLRNVFLIGKRHPDVFLRYCSKASSLALIGLVVGLISMSSAIYFFPMWILFGFSFATMRLSQGNAE